MEENQIIPASDNKQPKTSGVNIFLIGIIFLLLFALVGGAAYLYGLQKAKTTATPAPSATPAETPGKEPFVSPSPTVKPQKTPTPTPTPTPTATPEPTPEPQADLYISEYSFNHPPKMGEAFSVRIGIYNQGNKAASGFYWEWWATSAIMPCRQRIDSLAAHSGVIVNCTFTYGGWSTYTTKAIADADKEVAESNEDNNVKEETVIPIH